MERRAVIHSPERVHDLLVLMDAYDPLLPPRQRQVMRLKLEEDLSLGEISETLGVSRQACEDAIRRCERTLFAFEEKLGLARKSQEHKAMLAFALTVLRDMTASNWSQKRDFLLGYCTRENLGGEVQSGI